VKAIKISLYPKLEKSQDFDKKFFAKKNFNKEIKKT